MKVMCVNCGIESPLCEDKSGKYIKEGETYTVIKTETGYSTFARQNITAYFLKGFKCCFDVRLFIPLSNIDEINNHTHSESKKQLTAF